MEKTKEWGLVVELAEMIRELDTENQQDFVSDLFTHLDPYLPFIDQRSQRQLDYLYALHDKFMNGNDEAFEDWDE